MSNLPIVTIRGPSGRVAWTPQQAYALVFAVAVAALAAVAGGAVLPSGISPLAWASAVASGILYYGAAYLFYLAALGRLPASTAPPRST
jgi:drug/metabolite transporter (DMT)-like permease